MRVTGADGLHLLQKLVSQDLSGLGAAAPAAYTLLLTPQGKYLYDFFVLWTADALYLDTPANQTDAVITCLNRYKLRSDVSFAIMPETFLQLSEKPADGLLCVADPRSGQLGYRIWGGPPAVIDSSYEQRLTAAGVVEPSVELISGSSMPIDFGLQNINAISFTKGCYLGQELTARMQHRNLAKHVILVAKIQHNQNVGTNFECVVKDTSGVEIGTVLRVAMPYFLLHIRQQYGDETTFNLSLGAGCSTVQLARC